jgi:acetyltransferase-like isoleucine patch superfamily enzyme
VEFCRLLDFYTVVSTLGTALVCDGDGKLGHIVPGTATSDRVLRVVAVRPDAEAKICLLEAPDSASGITVGKHGSYQKILSLQQFGEMESLFFLQHPDSSDYLQLAPLAANGFGAASFENIEVTEVPAFLLVPISDFGTAGALTRLADDFSFNAEWLHKLIAAGDESFWPLIPNFLRRLKVSDVRVAWSSVSRWSVHDEVYPVIDSYCRTELAQFSFNSYTADFLKNQSAAFGWSIGEHSYGKPTIFEPSLGKLTIGRYCSMADPRIILGNHTTSSASSYPFMSLWAQWPGTVGGMDDHTPRDVVIGNDVWTGVGAIILPGAVIGDGAVIGAGAVVSGKIAPYSVCGGVPATSKRKRFDEPTVERLLALQWWQWPNAVVDRYIPLLLKPDPQEFLAAAEAEFGSGPKSA